MCSLAFLLIFLKKINTRLGIIVLILRFQSMKNNIFNPNPTEMKTLHKE